MVRLDEEIRGGRPQNMIQLTRLQEGREEGALLLLLRRGKCLSAVWTAPQLQ